MTALGATRDALHRRRLLWRAAHLAVAFALLIPPLVALAALAWPPLAGWIALPATYLAALVTDTLLIARWRRTLLRLWFDGAENLGAFAGAVATLPGIPASTISVMFRSLPILSPLQDRDLTMAERRVLACLCDWRWCNATAAALLPLAAATLASVAPVALMPGWGASVQLAAALLLAAILARFALPWVHRRRFLRALRLVPACTRDGLCTLASSLDWSGIHETRRQSFLSGFYRSRSL